MKRQKKGISLIILVVSILIIIIIAFAVIISVSNTNIFNNTNEALFKSDLSNYRDELMLKKNSGYLSNGSFKQDYTSEEIDEAITCIKEEDKEKYIIDEGDLVYIGHDPNEKKWARELGILVREVDEISVINIEQIEATGNSITIRTTMADSLDRYTLNYSLYDEANNCIITRTKKMLYSTDSDVIRLFDKTLMPNTNYRLEVKATYLALTYEKNDTALKTSEVALSVVPDKSEYVNTDVIVNVSSPVMPLESKMFVYFDDVLVDTFYVPENEVGISNNVVAENNCQVLAKIVSIHDDSIEYAAISQSVTNIDKADPITASVSSSDIYYDSFKLVATASDAPKDNLNACTGISTYEYYIDGTLYQSSSSATCNVTGRQKATNYNCYIIVKDLVGNHLQSSTISVTTLDTYPITYNSNGGSAAPAADTKIQGINKSISSATLTNSNADRTFAGWDTSSSAQNIVYRAGATYTQDAPLDLYAVWTHVHVASCKHTHTSSCYKYTYHTSHTSSCYHKHTSSCYHSHYSSCYHSHSTSCYSLQAQNTAAASGTCYSDLYGSYGHSSRSSGYSASEGRAATVCSRCGTTLSTYVKVLTCGKTTSTLVCGYTTSSIVCGKSTSTLICGKNSSSIDSSTLICGKNTTSYYCGKTTDTVVSGN